MALSGAQGVAGRGLQGGGCREGVAGRGLQGGVTLSVGGGGGCSRLNIVYNVNLFSRFQQLLLSKQLHCLQLWKTFQIVISNSM